MIAAMIAVAIASSVAVLTLTVLRGRTSGWNQDHLRTILMSLATILMAITVMIVRN